MTSIEPVTPHSPEDDEEEEGEEREWAGLSPRRKARAVALQVLFELDLTRHTPEVALEWNLTQRPLSPRGEGFVRRLVAMVREHLQGLDLHIQRFAPAWPVSQLPVVDRNLLRLAIYEMTMEAADPPKVTINEAVELAKLFGSESSPRFVNGVLGSLLESMENQRA